MKLEKRKTCSCGAVFDGAEWKALVRVGFMSLDDTLLELRNCSCGSTISIMRGRGSAQLTRAIRAVERARELTHEAQTLIVEARQHQSFWPI